MRIKNLTSTVQKLWIKNLLFSTSTQVDVLPNQPRELDSHYIPDKSKYPNFDELFEIEGLYKPKTVVEEKTEEIVDDIVVESQDVPEVEESQESTDPEVLESKFICDICQAEFGSARGLSSHKNRVHLDEQ